MVLGYGFPRLFFVFKSLELDIIFRKKLKECGKPRFKRMCYNAGIAKRNSHFCIFRRVLKYMLIKRREAAELQFLMNVKWFVSLAQLAKIHNVSERTIRYDIDNLNYFLRDIPAYIEISKKGIILHADIEKKQMIRVKLESLDIYDICFSEQDKINFIAMRLLTAAEPLTIKSFAEELSVSRSSLNQVMKEVSNWFEKQEIKVVRKPNFGIELKYTENQWRKAVISISNQETNKGYFYNFLIRSCSCNRNAYLNPANYALPYYSKLLFDEQDLDRMVDIVGYLEVLADIKLSDASFVGLMIHLTIALKRIGEGKEIEMPPAQLRQLQKQKEYKQAERFAEYLESEFQIKIPEGEIGYITLHLSGARREERDNRHGFDKIREIAVFLIMKVETYTGTKIGVEYIEGLIDNLSMHLRPAMIRVQNDLHIKNPILEEIRGQYPQLFEITQAACAEIEKEYGLAPFPSDEIAYIVMHIGAALEKTAWVPCGKIRAVIMCASGIGTAELLSGRLKREFMQLDIIGELSLLELDQVETLGADILITTLDVVFECRIPVVKVSPLLNTEDIRKIENVLQLKHIAWNDNFKEDIWNIQNILDGIEKIAEKHGSLRNKNDFRSELYQYIMKYQQKNKEELPMLSELISPERINAGYEAENWEDAVREAGRLLVETGCAGPQYVDAMIRTVEELGPYIVLSKGLALPHARPEAGARKIAMSLVLLKNPVNFGNKNHDPVEAVFALCAVDNSTHVQALADLGKFATLEENFKKLLSLSDADTIYRFIKGICEAEEKTYGKEED